MEDEEFSTIDIEATPEQQDLMVEAYVLSTFRPESVVTYKTDRAAGESVKDALYHAVFNEFAIAALIETINRSSQDS